MMTQIRTAECRGGEGLASRFSVVSSLLFEGILCGLPMSSDIIIFKSFGTEDTFCAKARTAIPLAMITMGKSIHWFPFLSYMGMGLHHFAQVCL